MNMPLKDFGVKMYAMNIIVNDKAADEEAPTIQKVVRAVLAEYDAVRADPDAAADYFLKLFPERDPKYVRNSLRVVAGLLGDGRIGEQTAQGWRDTIKLLKEAGLLGKEDIDPEAVTAAGYLAE